MMELEFGLPAPYKIRVKGYLDESWSDRLGGMAVEAVAPEGSTPETILVGWLADQAALCGVLNALYDLHLPLVSVELISVET